MFVVECGDGPIDAADEAAIEIRCELLDGRSTKVPEPAAGVHQRAIGIDWHRIATPPNVIGNRARTGRRAEEGHERLLEGATSALGEGRRLVSLTVSLKRNRDNGLRIRY